MVSSLTLRNGYDFLCKTLVRANAEVNSIDNDGDTPLQLAIRYVVVYKNE